MLIRDDIIYMKFPPRIRKSSEWKGIKVSAPSKDEKTLSKGGDWNENGWSFKPRDIGITSAATRRRRQFTGEVHGSEVNALRGGLRKAKLISWALILFILIDLVLLGVLFYWLLT